MDLSERTNSVYRHPWELSRTEIILKELKRLKIHGKVLDIGCGDGYFDSEMLKMFPEITEFWGIDIYADEDSCRCKGRENYVNSYDKLDGKKFDYVLLMDVIEHIEKDILFMKGLHKYLHDGSILLITVPAFQWLFSLHDRELHHYRRYSYKSLYRVLKIAGYDINDYCYAYFTLIPMRIFTKNKTKNLGMWKYAENRLITKMIKYCLNFDYMILRLLKKLGISVGGLSLLAVCQQRRRCKRKKIRFQ